MLLSLVPYLCGDTKETSLDVNGYGWVVCSVGMSLRLSDEYMHQIFS